MSLINDVLIDMHSISKRLNVFIVLDDSIEEDKSIQLQLNDNEIIINVNDNQSSIALPYEIDSKLTTIQHADKKFISFGAALKSLDKIKNELLLEASKKSSIFETDFHIKIHVKPNERYNIICSCCNNQFLDKVKSFKRVLELPTGPIEMFDWFCHEKINYDKILSPLRYDLHYGLYHIVLNKDILCNYIIKRGHFYCQNCLQYIGKVSRGNKSVCLWGDCINLMKENDKTITNIFDEIDEFSKYCDNKVILNIISKCLYFDLNNEKPFSLISTSPFTKILIQAVFSNQKEKYLMINIVRNNVEIFRKYENQLDVCKDNKNNENDIKTETYNINLINNKAFKLLYKIIENENQPLLDFWKHDFNVQCIKTSYKIYIKFVETLSKNSSIIPHPLRYCNDFTLSYVFY